MICFIVIEHKDIIKIKHNKFIYEMSQNLIHQPHECDKCIY